MDGAKGMREHAKWLKLMRFQALVLKGSPESRAMIREHDWKWPDGTIICIKTVLTYLQGATSLMY